MATPALNVRFVLFLALILVALPFFILRVGRSGGRNGTLYITSLGLGLCRGRSGGLLFE